MLRVQLEGQLVQTVVRPLCVLLEVAQGVQTLGNPLSLSRTVVAVDAQDVCEGGGGTPKEVVGRLRPLGGEGEGGLRVEGGRVAEELGVAADQRFQGRTAEQLGPVGLEAEHDEEGAHQNVGAVLRVAELRYPFQQFPEGAELAQPKHTLQLVQYGLEGEVTPVAREDGVGLVARGEEMLIDDGMEPQGNWVLGV